MIYLYAFFLALSLAALGWYLWLRVSRRSPTGAAALLVSEPGELQRADRLRRSLLSATLIVSLGAVVLLVLTLFFRAQYSAARNHLELDEYRQAEQALERLPEDYEDADCLRLWCQAGLQYAAGNPQAALELAAMLNDAYPTQELVTRARYLWAEQRLLDRDFAQAHSLFEALGSYADARKRLVETDVAWARQEMDQGKLLSAKARLDAYTPEETGRYILQDLEDLLWRQAQRAYRDGDLDGAQKLTQALADESKTGKLDVLLRARLNPGRKTVQAVLELGDYEDAYLLLVSRDFLRFYLEGRWTDKQGHFLSLSPDNQMEFAFPHPAVTNARHRFESGELWLYPAGKPSDAVLLARVTAVSAKKLKLTNGLDGETYTLTRAS